MNLFYCMRTSIASIARVSQTDKTITIKGWRKRHPFSLYRLSIQHVVHKDNCVDFNGTFAHNKCKK